MGKNFSPFKQPLIASKPLAQLVTQMANSRMPTFA